MLKHLHAFAVTLGFTAHTGEIVPEQAVVAFKGIGFRFGLSVLRLRYESFIRALGIGHPIPYGQWCY